MSSRGNAESELAPQIAIIRAPTGAYQPGAILNEVRVGPLGRAMPSTPAVNTPKRPARMK
jgi:hypothetical protein